MRLDRVKTVEATMADVPSPKTSWLVVVDMQNAFLDPDVPWSTKEHGLTIVEPIRKLVARWSSDRTIFTRYISREGSSFEGSWKEYFKDPGNGFYDRDRYDPVFDIVPELKPLVKHCVTVAAFDKWGSKEKGIRSLLKEEYPSLVMTGVSTECCVWSTASAAAESGAFVTIVRDACAALDDDVTSFFFDKVVPSYSGLIDLKMTKDLL